MGRRGWSPLGARPYPPQPAATKLRRIRTGTAHGRRLCDPRARRCAGGGAGFLCRPGSGSASGRLLQSVASFSTARAPRAQVPSAVKASQWGHGVRQENRYRPACARRWRFQWSLLHRQVSGKDHRGSRWFDALPGGTAEKSPTGRGAAVANWQPVRIGLFESEVARAHSRRERAAC